MKKFLSTWVFILLYISANAQNRQAARPATDVLSEGAALLFKNVRTQLTSAEKTMIFRKLGFVLSNDQEQPFAQDAESMEYPFPARALPTDMNKDGKEEVFILFGNSFTSGSTGSSVLLLIKDANGKFQNNLGFPGMLQILPAANKGYNDLLIGGPGFEFPIWRWNGKEYTLYKTIKDSELQKIKMMEVEDVSNVYQESLNK